jgi:hypothetical protein
MKIIPFFLLLQIAISFSVFGTILGNAGIFSGKDNTNTYDFSPSDTTYRVIKAHDNTFGYEILINDRPIIRQQTIPGRSGVNGFKNRSEAEKVARCVLIKARKGIIPPSIGEEELVKLKISY